MNIKLTVLFEAPFWVGIFERTYEKYEVSRVVFGSEPKDFEIYALIIQEFGSLKFSKPLSVEVETQRKISPKKLQRIVKKEVKETGLGTKAQNALKLERELLKQERKILSNAEKEALEKFKFEKNQEKKKEKKKGH
jgi:hypothetical protein